MLQNPAVVEALGRDRVRERRQSARRSGLGRRDVHGRRFTAAARQGTGWLLVDLGLRLAVPRGGRS